MIIEKGIYYAKNEIYQMINNIGGDCGKPGRRPIVCLIKSIEHPEIFWAIPMGAVSHRSENAMKRIRQYLAYEDADIRSCFYHLGRTTTRSIFFISDAFPITDNYIEECHLGYNDVHYIIKNHILISELERKLFRILAYENANPNYFRQRITDVKKYLLQN